MFIVEALETFINEDEDENENFSNYTNYEGVENNEVIELSVSTDLRGGRRTRNPWIVATCVYLDWYLLKRYAVEEESVACEIYMTCRNKSFMNIELLE